MAPLASGIKALVDEVLKRLPAELANAVIAYMDKVYIRLSIFPRIYSSRYLACVGFINFSHLC